MVKPQTRLPEEESLPGVPARTEFNRALEDLAGRLLGGNRRKREQFADQIAAMHRAGIGKDFIIIHSPGGWGNTSWEGLLAWEMSIVTGVTSTLDKLGYSSITVQYLRSGKRRWAHLLDIARDIGFFMTGESPRASVLAEGLRLLEEYLPGARLILVGASQGAAFNNATVKALNNGERVYSIELGTFFPYMKHRLLTPRTLAIDSNGLMPDPICHRNLRAATKEYFFAVGRWIRLKMNGQKVKFTHCVNTPGHEYAWVYPAVHTNITVFLKEKFGKAKQVGEVGDEPG